MKKEIKMESLDAKDPKGMLSTAGIPEEKHEEIMQAIGDGTILKAIITFAKAHGVDILTAIMTVINLLKTIPSGSTPLEIISAVINALMLLVPTPAPVVPPAPEPAA